MAPSPSQSPETSPLHSLTTPASRLAALANSYVPPPLPPLPSQQHSLLHGLPSLSGGGGGGGGLLTGLASGGVGLTSLGGLPGGAGGRGDMGFGGGRNDGMSGSGVNGGFATPALPGGGGGGMSSLEYYRATLGQLSRGGDLRR
ncbi:hypothetical protein HK097_009633, partial [Rhizophlyctis rosea]